MKAAAALTAGAVAGPMILPRSLFGADAPSKHLTMGFVGMGKQARGLLQGFLSSKTVSVLSVCDVDTTRRNDAKQKVDNFYVNSPEKPVENICQKLHVRNRLEAVAKHQSKSN